MGGHIPKAEVHVVAENLWRVRFKRDVAGRPNDFWEGPIVAYWEVYYDPISDDYTTREIDARTLLRRWAERVKDTHPDDLVPIYWSAWSEEAAKFEAMPFQFLHGRDNDAEDFLTFYHWPENAKTGAPLNWLSLPVVDKFWNEERGGDKGGFIQEATGWKPSILQPFVYLPALMRSLGSH
jgi:hypothetical protein